MHDPHTLDGALAYNTCLHAATRNTLMPRREHSPAVAAAILANNTVAEVLDWLLTQPADSMRERAIEMHLHLTGADAPTGERCA